jgi:predicted enzyme related to lactoylglutathione lyase
MRVLINIDVPDLQAGIAFYQAALGLRLHRVLDDDVAEMHGAACTLFLLQNPAGSSATATAEISRDYARHWTPVHMDFVVDDLDAAAARAEAAGASREAEPVAWRGSTCITYSDPFGHGFCLIQFDGQTYR